MVKENFILQMETYMKDNFMMINLTVKENILLLVEELMKVNLKMVN